MPIRGCCRQAGGDMQIGIIKPLAAALGAALVLALPAAASADETFCVQAPNCIGPIYPTPQAALDAAKDTPGNDVVQLGQAFVPYEGSLVYDDPSPGNHVTLRGAGIERTALTATTPTTVELASGSSIEDLMLASPDLATGGRGLVLHGGAARRVLVAYTGDFAATKGLVVDGSAELTDVRVLMKTGSAIMVKGSGADVDGEDVVARGRFGVTVDQGATLTLQRARIWAQSIGAVASGGASGLSTLVIRNAEILAHSPGADGILGISGSALYANHVTALHLGPGGGTGVGTSGLLDSSTASVRNTVIDGFEEHSLERSSIAPYAASQYLEFVSFDPATAAIDAAQGPGGTSQLGTLFVSDPMFADRPLLEPTEDHDLRLQPGSPLVDAGVATAAALPLDLGKLDRVTDGNGDGVEVPDIGAHELPQQAAGGGTTGGGTAGGGGTGGGGQEGGTTPMTDTLAPTLAGLGAGARRARFRLSEQARVTLRLKRRGQRRARVLRVSGAAGRNRVAFRRQARRLRTGRYRLAAHAVDTAGNRSRAVVVRFRVSR